MRVTSLNCTETTRKPISKCNPPDVKTRLFVYNNGNEKKKSFWFMTINNAFSNQFWDQWISAINEMRFCVGLRGKQEVFVRCSSNEEGAIFTTSQRSVYHAKPLSNMEEKILSLARFVMSFQKALVEKLFGEDFIVTWDSNLLHHVVGPIHAAVYGAHSDFSSLLCSTKEKTKLHVHNDVYLPQREEMQVLTIFCSNYQTECKNNDYCTSLSYTFKDSIIGSETLGSRGIHIQGPGSQAIGIKHDTKVNQDAHQSGVYQCLCTTRLTVVPRHGKLFQERMQLAGTFQVNEETNVCTINQYYRRAVITEITSSYPLPSIQKLTAEQQTCTGNQEKLSELDAEYHKPPIHIKSPKKNLVIGKKLTAAKTLPLVRPKNRGGMEKLSQTTASRTQIIHEITNLFYGIPKFILMFPKMCSTNKIFHNSVQDLYSRTEYAS
jgi:hypothetical protein